MPNLVRKFPNSLTGLATSLRTLQQYCQTMSDPAALFPPDVLAFLQQPQIPFLQSYAALQGQEAVMLEQLARKTAAVEKLKLFVGSFMVVMKYALKRSLMLNDGLWRATDLAFYNLDERGGRLPLLNKEEMVKYWARTIIKGEQTRLLVNPLAQPMTNPSVAEVQALQDEVEAATTPALMATSAYNTTRQTLQKQLKDTNRILRKAWDYLDAAYGHLPMETKRETLRGFGVVYYNTGKATTLTLLVKDSEGKALPGANAILMQTGATTTANKEGRITLKTKTDGEVQLQITHPATQSATVTFTITRSIIGTTLTAPDLSLPRK